MRAFRCSGVGEAILLPLLALTLLGTGCQRSGTRPGAPAAHPASAPFSGNGAAQDLAQVAKSIRLVRIADDATGLYMPDVFDSVLNDPNLRSAAEANAFAKWKKYEDQYVSFEYPDHPTITLAVEEANSGVMAVGGAVGTTENTWFRNYLLKLGNAAYCPIMLDRQDDFDDGDCFCGMVAIDKYLFHNGALFRFSLLEDGRVKKVQALCKGLRVEFFEWTHMPIDQAVYVRIALSLRMKNGPCDQAKMRESILSKYGEGGRLGFLELGMKREDVLRLLGKPTREDGESLVFVEGDDLCETVTRIPLPDGVFRGLGKGWRTSRYLPPARGSPQWIIEMSGRVKRGDYDLGPRTKDVVQYMFDRFVELAPTAKASDWRILCEAMTVLATGEEEEKDPRVYRVVADRFLDTDLPQVDAAFVLHSYDPNGSRALFIKLAKLIHEKARPKSQSDPEVWMPSLDSPCFLYGFIGEDDPQYAALVLEGMKHPNDFIRADAFQQWESNLPPAELLANLRRGLSDPDEYVREKSAMAFAERFGDKTDLPLLRERMKKKEDRSAVLENLAKAIYRLERQDGNDPARRP